VFIEPFRVHFDPIIGWPSIPIDTYLRLMFLKFRYRLGYELLCREVADSISWQRFSRIPLGGRMPHPTTLVKLTRRVGEQAVDGLNQALLAWAADKLATTVKRVQAAGGATRTRVRDRRHAAHRRAHEVAWAMRSCTGEAKQVVLEVTRQVAGLAEVQLTDARRVVTLGFTGQPRPGDLREELEPAATLADQQRAGAVGGGRRAEQERPPGIDDRERAWIAARSARQRLPQHRAQGAQDAAPVGAAVARVVQGVRAVARVVVATVEPHPGGARPGALQVGEEGRLPGRPLAG
jgi:IS5 family transposase